MVINENRSNATFRPKYHTSKNQRKKGKQTQFQAKPLKSTRLEGGAPMAHSAVLALAGTSRGQQTPRDKVRWLWVKALLTRVFVLRSWGVYSYLTFLTPSHIAMGQKEKPPVLV